MNGGERPASEGGPYEMGTALENCKLVAAVEIDLIEEFAACEPEFQ
jgi:hypothetical protein